MNPLGITSFVLCIASLPALAQQATPATRPDQAPIYHVVVEQRSLPALNYGHTTGSTKIDFRGTVLLPKAKGEAKVEPKSGAMGIDTKFENLTPPTRFGPQYLTYVLWAITPDGRPSNLGEVLPGSSNKAKLDVTTHLPAFGLIVTAEPYFAVTQPSNVVVLENVMRPDTAGKVEEVQAKYELLPRSGVAAQPVEARPSALNGATVKQIPLDQYDAVLALYQAQNAVQIARAQGAGRYAPDTLQRAEQLYQQAQTKMQGDKNDRRQVVTIAREAAQVAEDARTITMKRQQPAQPAQTAATPNH